MRGGALSFSSINIDDLDSAHKDYRNRRGILYTLAEFASGVTGLVFVYGYFNPELTDNIGWLVIPLLVYAIA